MRIIALLVVLLICSVGISSATDYYVSTTGDNSNDGLTMDTPKYNWSSSWFNATTIQAGDTIYLVNGTWIGETLLLPTDGNSTHPITITSYNGTPTLNGNGVFNLVGIAINARNYSIVSNISFFNFSSGSSRPVQITTGHDNLVTNVDVEYSGQLTISQGYAWNNTVSNSVFNDGLWNMVQITGENTGLGTGRYNYNMVVNNNTFNSVSRYHVAGVDLFGNLENTLIENNTFNGVNSTGIYGHSSPDRRYNTTIRNNLFEGGTDAPLKLGEEENLIIKNNIFSNITGFQQSIVLWYNDFNVTIADNSFYNTTQSVVRADDCDTILLDSNYIDSTATKYRIADNVFNVTLRNPLGEKVFWLSNTWLNQTVEVDYLDGTVFSYSNVGTVNATEITHHPTKSNMSMSSTSSTITIIPYSMTAKPTTNTSTVAINIFNTSEQAGNIAVNFTTNSTDGTQVDFTIWDLFTNHDYQIKKDENQFQNVTSNSTGYISFSNSIWSEKTFTIQDLGYNESTFVPDAVPYLGKRFNTYQSGNVTHLETINSSNTKLDFFMMVVI